MKLINKLYILLIPVILLALMISIYVNINEFNKRIDEAQKNYISANIEDVLNLQNNPIFLHYFDSVQYDLIHEAKIDQENIKLLFNKKYNINQQYSGSMEHIVLVSKNKDIIATASKELNLEIGRVHADKYLENKPYYKSIASIITEQYHGIIVPIYEGDRKELISKDELKGFLVVVYKLQIQSISQLKKEILTNAILFNSLFLAAFLLIIYLISKQIAEPINYLAKQIETLDLEEYENIKLNTNIKEFLFLNQILLENSKEIVKEKKEIADLNATLEEKVKLRTKELEDARDNIKQYQLLFSQNKTIMLFIEPDTEAIIDANQAALNFYGYTYDEIKKLNMSNINTFSSDEMENEIKKSQLEKRNYFIFRHKLKDETIKDVEVHYGYINIKNKSLQYYIIHDITEEIVQKMLAKEEEEILQHQAKLISMGEMLENVSHQWRQPLTIISTSASAIQMEKEFETLTDEYLESSLLRIIDTTKKLSKTIDNFIDFFKTNDKKENFKLYDLWNNTLEIVGSKFKNIGISININIQDIEDVQIYGIKSELAEVIMNVLDNSRDALESKNIDEKYIFVQIYKENNNAVIIIQDSGGGIQDDIINKIFEPYFTTKHKYQGIGLGLYRSEEIINKHLGGVIQVSNSEVVFESKKFMGAKFIITLPLS